MSPQVPGRQILHDHALDPVLGDVAAHAAHAGCGARLQHDVLAFEAPLGSLRVEGFPELLHEAPGVGAALGHLDQVGQGFDRFALAEVIAERLPPRERVVVLEPVREQSARDLRCPRVTLPAPPPDRAAQAVDE